MKIALFDLLVWGSLRLAPINSNNEVQRNKCVYVVDGNQSSSYSLFCPLTSVSILNSTLWIVLGKGGLANSNDK